MDFGPTTPCHRIRPSVELVLISSSMVSGESWALRERRRIILICVNIEIYQTNSGKANDTYLRGKMDFGRAMYPSFWK